MDKRFIALALVALVGLASAAGVSQGKEEESQLVIYQDDANEVAGLSAEMKELFGDYCLSSRDYVKSYKDAKGKSAIDELFSLYPAELFKSIKEYGVLVDDGQSCDLVQVDFKSKWVAVADVLDTIARGTWDDDFWYLSYNHVLAPFGWKSDEIIDSMWEKNGLARILNGCSLIRDTLKPALMKQFSSTKEKLSGKNEHIDDILGSTDFLNVGCALTKDLETLSVSCRDILRIPVEKFNEIGVE